MISGNIPEKITILTRQPITVEGETVTPAFISDAKNEKTLETGRSWADHSQWGVKYEKGLEVNRENKGLSGYRILDLEVRSEGGRAYKVVSPAGFYVDMREDVLLDTIKKVGISPGGLLNGVYLFATVGSQMKLVREGSTLHKELIGATTRRNSKKISSKDLEIGGVYSTLGGKEFIFGGFVDTEEVKITEVSGTGYNRYDKTFKYSEPIPLKKMQLWIETSGDPSYQEKFEKDIAKSWFSLYVGVTKDKKIVGKIGTVDKIDFVKAVKDNYKAHKKTDCWIGNNQYSRAYHSKELNIVPAASK